MHYRTTNQDGRTVTVTASTQITTVNPNFREGTSSNNTAAIVGGVVGGIAGLAALILLLWFCRRRSKRDEFDGNFDPDRVGIGKGGRGDLLAAGSGASPGAEVTPYAYQDGAGGMGQTHAGVPPSLLAGGAATGAGAYGLAHSNTAHSRSNSAGSDHDGYARSDGDDPSRSPTNTSSGGGYSYGGSPYAAVGAALAGGYAGQHGTHPSPGPSVPSSSGHSHYGPPPNAAPGPSTLAPPAGAAATGAAAALPQFRSAKEREAYLARNRLRQDGTPMTGAYSSGLAVRNSGVPSDGDGATSTGAPGSGGSATDDGSHVVVHQDGGRVPDEDETIEPNEIPPTYDSIRRDA